MRSLVQALATVRFLVLVAAMEFLVLRTPEARRWVYRLVAASAAWIVLNSVIQYIFGRNLIGWPPAAEGVLTGPFGTARAGPPMARIIIPAVLPPVANLLKRRNRRATAGAYALLLGSVLVMVLIGQRMPLVLTLFGLVIVALLIRWLRPLVLAAGGGRCAAARRLAGGRAQRVLPAGGEVLDADGAFRRCRRTASSIRGRGRSACKNPITGMGFDGFGTGCPRPAYFRPTFDGKRAAWRWREDLLGSSAQLLP